MVVELAVLDRPDLPFLIGDGLMAAGDVNYGEAAHAQGYARSEMGSAIVWTAVSHDVGHAVERLRRDDAPRLAVELNDSTDPAHLH